MKELQDKYHYDPEKAAAAYAVQAAAVQQTNQQSGELDKKHKDAYQAQLEQQAKGQNIQALVNTYQNLVQQEEELLTQIGQIRKAQEVARRRYVNGFYASDSHLTDASEANLPLLEGRLQNVRNEKEE